MGVSNLPQGPNLLEVFSCRMFGFKHQARATLANGGGACRLTWIDYLLMGGLVGSEPALSLTVRVLVWG